MFALIWVILLLADKGSGTNQQEEGSAVIPSSSGLQSTENTTSGSFSSSTTTLETTTYSKKVKISGNAAVKKGDTLNLACSAEGLPGSSISWTKSGSNKSLNNETRNGTPTNGSAFLIISNVKAEHYGQYICNATHHNESFTETINVTSFEGVPRIVNSSKCERQSGVLTCVCISEGFPSPTINWPLVKNLTEYSVNTTVSNGTMTSSITVPLKHFHSTTVECVSSNNFGNKSVNLNITAESQGNTLFKKVLTTARELQGIIVALMGFVIGIILSIILCLVTKSCRKKQKTSENLSENLEMVTTEAFPMMDADEAVVYDGIYEQEAAEGEAQPAGQSAPDGDLAPKEVEYSKINFSAKKSRNPEEAVKTTETEYAEIKTEEKRQENDQEDSEMLEGNEENEMMTGEDNDANEAEKEGDEDVPLYSSVEEIMG